MATNEATVDRPGRERALNREHQRAHDDATQRQAHRTGVEFLLPAREVTDSQEHERSGPGAEPGHRVQHVRQDRVTDRQYQIDDLGVEPGDQLYPLREYAAHTLTVTVVCG